MATSQEILELIYKVQGEGELKALNALAEKHRETLGFLVAQNKNLTAAELAQSSAVQVQASALAKTEAQARALEAALGRTTSKMAGFGQTALQSGRIIQDFTQGGFGGIINNIEGITQALGLGAGLAGVLTIVGTAAFIAMPHIKAFIASLQGEPVKLFATEIDKLNDQIKTIQDKETKVDFDFTEIDRLKREIDALTKGKQALDRIMGKKTEEVVASEKAVEDLVSTPEGKASLDVVKQIMIAEGVAGDKDVQKAATDVTSLTAKVAGAAAFYQGVKGTEDAPAAFMALAKLQDQQKEAEQRLLNARRHAAQSAESAAGELATDATRQKELVRRLDAAGQRELAAKVEAASPEKIVEGKKLAEASRAMGEAVGAEMERADRGAKKLAEDRTKANELMGKAVGEEMEDADKQLKGKQDIADEAKKADELRKRFIESQADLFRKGFEGPLGAAMGAGMTDAEARKRVAFDLQAGGLVPGGDINEVAANLVAAERQKIGGGVAGGGAPDPFADAFGQRRRAAPRQPPGIRQRVPSPDIQEAPNPFDLGANGNGPAAVADPLLRGLGEQARTTGAAVGAIAAIRQQVDMLAGVQHDMRRALAGVGRAQMGRI